MPTEGVKLSGSACPGAQTAVMLAVRTVKG